MTSRACLRCIAKKRKCDHREPKCESCVKANEECSYPPPRQRRGPMQGLTKVLEDRVDEYERALWFLLDQEGVKELLRAHVRERGPGDVLGPTPRTLQERDHRREWWKNGRLKTLGDLQAFRTRLQDETWSSMTADDPVHTQSISDAHTGTGMGTGLFGEEEGQDNLPHTQSVDPGTILEPLLTASAQREHIPITTASVSDIPASFMARPPDLFAQWSSPPPVARSGSRLSKRQRKLETDDVFW